MVAIPDVHISGLSGASAAQAAFNAAMQAAPDAASGKLCYRNASGACGSGGACGAGATGAPGYGICAWRVDNAAERKQRGLAAAQAWQANLDAATDAARQAERRINAERHNAA